MSHLTTDLFNSLYRKHYEQLFYYAYGFTDDAEVCRDILADVFESLWTHRKKITQETAHSYLYQCVRNKCIDYVRHQQLNRQYESFIKGTADTDTDMEPDATEERMQTVQECIDLLPPKTKLVLEECYFHNKKYKEVATALDISTNAIKKHIVKALSVLRERYRGLRQIQHVPQGAAYALCSKSISSGQLGKYWH